MPADRAPTGFHALHGQVVDQRTFADHADQLAIHRVDGRFHRETAVGNLVGEGLLDPRRHQVLPVGRGGCAEVDFRFEQLLRFTGSRVDDDGLAGGQPFEQRLVIGIFEHVLVGSGLRFLAARRILDSWPAGRERFHGHGTTLFGNGQCKDTAIGKEARLGENGIETAIEQRGDLGALHVHHVQRHAVRIGVAEDDLVAVLGPAHLRNIRFRRQCDLARLTRGNVLDGETHDIARIVHVVDRDIEPEAGKALHRLGDFRYWGKCFALHQQHGRAIGRDGYRGRGGPCHDIGDGRRRGVVSRLRGERRGSGCDRNRDQAGKAIHVSPPKNLAGPA